MDSQEPRTIDIGNFRPGKPPTKVILYGALVLIGALVIFSAVFTIQPEEVGIVLRFGEFNRTADPGLNFKLPSPIEQVLKVPSVLLGVGLNDDNIHAPNEKFDLEQLWRGSLAIAAVLGNLGTLRGR